MDPLIIRAVFSDRPLHPVEIGLEKEVFLGPLAETEDVGPEIVGVADVIGALEKLVDEIGPLGRRLRIEEPYRVVEGRNLTGEFEMDAADELRVGERVAAGDAVLVPVLLKKAVDLPGGCLHGWPPCAVDRCHLHDGTRCLFEHRRRQPRSRLPRVFFRPLLCPRRLGRRRGLNGQRRRHNEQARDHPLHGFEDSG